MKEFVFNLESITPDLWMKNEELCKEKILKMPSWTQIPLINCNASHSLPDHSLVRFRGMVQDMHNPEFYFESFEVINSLTNEVKMKSGKYRDTADVGENEKINYSSNLNSGQRQPFVVVSMPGLNDWAKEMEDKENKLLRLEQLPNTSMRLGTAAFKRPREPCEDMETGEGRVPDATLPAPAKLPTTTPRACEHTNSAQPVSALSREHILNFPLPDMESKSCLVKAYDDSEELKLNEMIEVVGFLSVDPSLSAEFRGPGTDGEEMEELVQPPGELQAETLTLHPPPSLVPRLHAVLVRKLDHCNPLVTEPAHQESILSGAAQAREHLMKALKELLLGDELAADYLICHLISCVYLRQDALVLGQFVLNLSNIPVQLYPNYTQQLYNIIKQFVTKSYYLPLTLDNLNTMSFLPKKDYECNRLTSGVLQLSAGTHLVLDETCMEAGRLGPAGVAHVAALGALATTQRVQYDFKYYKMDFSADVPMLVLSEGKSLLPCEFHVPLKPEESSIGIFNEIVEAATYYLKSDIMNCIRKYLTEVKLVTFTMSEDLQFVEDDFIAMRREASSGTGSGGERGAGAEDLHRLLVLARLVSLARGRGSLQRDCWEVAKRMEEQRLQRLATEL